MSGKTTKKFNVPFKSPAASQVSSLPDDGFDESVLWYPEGYTTPKKQHKPIKPAHVKSAPIKKTSAPVRKTKQRPLIKGKENAMPAKPRIPKTPIKISRIIPKTPPRKKMKMTNVMKTPEGPNKRPRTPTFQMYGIKSPYQKSTPAFSQVSTPGLTQDTLLKKLIGK